MPTALTATSPSGSISTLTPVFAGTSYYPSATSGLIEVRRVSDSASIASIPFTAGAPVYAVPYTGPALVSAVQYQWRCREFNISSVEVTGSPTAWVSFTPYSNQTPTCALVSPAASAEPGTSTPTMIGNFSDGDIALWDDYFTAYQIQVRRVSDSVSFWDTGETAVSASERAANQFSKVYAGTALVNNTAYEWRARVKDSLGLWSNYTSWSSFTPKLKPNAPTITSPSGLSNTLTPDVDGTYNQGQGDTEASYQYQIRQATTTIYDSGEVAGAFATGQAYGTNNPSDTPATPPALAWGTQYYVRARSKDSLGAWSDWSGWTAFNTNAAPTTPTSLSPSAGSTTGDTTPRISWVHNDADSDAQTAVDIELRDVATSTAVTGYGPKTLSQATLYHDVTETLTASPATEYKYRVRTKGLAAPGYGPWSDWITFTVATAPTLTVTNPSVDETITAPALQVTWTFSGGSGTQQDYRVIIYADDAITIIHDSGVTAGTDLSYTLAVGILQNSTDYYVKVIVRDTLSQSADSGPIHFDTSWTPPATITGLTVTVIN